mmetsp:Transcript_33589/g.56411  ORF Transcript_33589/g.56411 Transcript_33589/m.56411 type:complete len:275 (-) Transcript_33589:122-946(-)
MKGRAAMTAASRVGRPPFASTCTTFLCPPSLNSSSVFFLMSERSRVSNEEEMKNAIRVTPIAKLAKQVIHPTKKAEIAPDVSSDLFFNPPIAIRHASPAETKQRIATACVCENQKTLMPARSAAKDTIVLPRELVAVSTGSVEIESEPAACNLKFPTVFLPLRARCAPCPRELSPCIGLSYSFAAIPVTSRDIFVTCPFPIFTLPKPLETFTRNTPRSVGFCEIICDAAARVQERLERGVIAKGRILLSAKQPNFTVACNETGNRRSNRRGAHR